ncbi:MAG: hypothetical protein Q9162_003191 [Coniocarpon cinnabarinum]
MPAPGTTTFDIYKRQLWALPTPTSTAGADACSAFTIPSGGSIVINNSSTITLSTTAVYQPPCSGGPALLDADGASVQPVDSYHDPFYASVTPQVYIVALTTAMAWLLMIALVLFQPSYNGTSARSLVQPWRRGDGLSSLFNSRSSPLPLGSRPWLQRFAALMVVIALTTVTADTFRNAQGQYNNGYSNASELRNDVAGSLEVCTSYCRKSTKLLTDAQVRVIRVISDLFLWLAQIQTLIRLFPRRREKLIIKWVGFVLTLLDIIFSCLNSFYIDTGDTDDRPRRYQDAIPALSYLFQLALNLLYAAWVLYFVMTKRRYAFYHYLMPEICIVAGVGLLSISVPVVFFLVDILEPDVSTWGDYFRWVGSAAASIIIWEWVERIEYLEREEKKDGILGREIFDEDDFDPDAPDGRPQRRHIDHSETRTDLFQRYQNLKFKNEKIEAALRCLTFRDKSRGEQSGDGMSKEDNSLEQAQERKIEPAQEFHSSAVEASAPASIESPIDRNFENSPGSTIYAVHYHPTSQTPTTTNDHTRQECEPPGAAADSGQSRPGLASIDAEKPVASSEYHPGAERFLPSSWLRSMNIFRKTRQSPPVEVKNALSMQQGSRHDTNKTGSSAKIFSDHQGATQSRAVLAPRQPTVIPPPVHGTDPWTPDSIRRATQSGSTKPLGSGVVVVSPPPPSKPTVDQTQKRTDSHQTANSEANAVENAPNGDLSGSTPENNESSTGEYSQSPE